MKKQKCSHNISALLAKNYAFKHADDAETQSIQNASCLLVYRCIEALNREQEIAAPMVMSYLMGWGDVYQSHNFVPVYWTSFIFKLFKLVHSHTFICLHFQHSLFSINGSVTIMNSYPSGFKSITLNFNLFIVNSRFLFKALNKRL